MAAPSCFLRRPLSASAGGPPPLPAPAGEPPRPLPARRGRRARGGRLGRGGPHLSLSMAAPSCSSRPAWLSSSPIPWPARPSSFLPRRGFSSIQHPPFHGRRASSLLPHGPNPSLPWPAAPPSLPPPPSPTGARHGGGGSSRAHACAARRRASRRPGSAPATRAGHGRPQLASPRLVPDRSRGGGARAEVRRRGALPAQAEFGERRWRDSGSARPLPYCSLLSRPPWWRRW